MKTRIIPRHMSTAVNYSGLSYCARRKVGCVIVKGDNITSIGYNGTPPKEDNQCEDEHGNTKPSVIHAEMNAIRKVEHDPELLRGTSMFVTTAPCKSCAAKIVEVGISSVFYRDQYRNVEGIQHLLDNNISVQQLEE